MIDAIEAYVLSRKQHNRIISQEIEAIEAAISDATDDGYFICEYQTDIPVECVRSIAQYIRDHKFTVTVEPGGLGKTIYIIKWDKDIEQLDAKRATTLQQELQILKEIKL